MRIFDALHIKVFLVIIYDIIADNISVNSRKKVVIGKIFLVVNLVLNILVTIYLNSKEDLEHFLEKETKKIFSRTHFRKMINFLRNKITSIWLFDIAN